MSYNYSDISLNEYPGQISLVISFRGCKFYCPYCFNPELTQFKELSFKQVKDAIDEHIGFIDAVVLTGGEPLHHKNLDKIISYCKAKKLKVKLNTNGFINHIQSPYQPLFMKVDYLNISLKDPMYCIYPKGFIYNYLVYGQILEYSMVYSPTLYPTSVLNTYVNKIKESILQDEWKIKENILQDKWSVPDIFTINQMQVGNCYNPEFNNIKVPTREELKEVALLFKDLPCKKIMIETTSHGKEVIYSKRKSHELR